MPLRPATSAKRRCDLRSSLAGGLFLPRTTARGDAQQLWLGLLKIAALDPGQLGAATGAGEAEQQQCPVAQPRQVIADRRQDLAQDADLRGEVRLGTLASRSSPAKVSVTVAVVVGERRPAR
jgi:hypothetical protein